MARAARTFGPTSSDHDLIVATQDEAVRSIVDALAIELTREEEQLLGGAAPKMPRRILVACARELLGHTTLESMAQARAM